MKTEGQQQLLLGSRGEIKTNKSELLNHVFFGVQAVAFFEVDEIPTVLCGCYNSCSLFMLCVHLQMLFLSLVVKILMISCLLLCYDPRLQVMLDLPFVFLSSWPVKCQGCFFLVYL